ncbi:hypothetical protein BD770DRAFT_378081 [Pilaira anomala]|nr:hypothetical protein BD770DRAFT_378081 [Pilaira anomala]
MSAVNIKSRPQSFVYPHFHDTQSTRRTNKETEIDKSVYHLLSLYLNADSLDKINSTPSLLSLPTKQSLKHTTSPYWRTKSNRNATTPKRNWLGEEESHRHSQQEMLLERNTLKNSTTTLVHNNDESVIKTIKKRTKSVSFNETVTVILSHDMKSFSQLKQADLETSTEDDDELIFVDALEFI